MHDWSASLCVQQVEDELSSTVVLFKYGQEMSAGKDPSHSIQEKHIWLKKNQKKLSVLNGWNRNVHYQSYTIWIHKGH